MLTIGDTFPEFSLTAVKGGPEGLKLDTAFTDITHETDAGKWKIVFFWPKDFTFICPTEIVAFGKMKAEFADRDTVVYGVSTDSEFVHLNWRLHHEDLKGLAIPMLADVKRELSAKLGVLSKAAGVALRATFIVDPDQRHPLRLGERPGRWSQPGRGTARAGRAAERRAVRL